MNLTLLRLDRQNPAHVRELQRVFEAAPTYHLNTGGIPAASTEAAESLAALPPGHGYETKFIYGILAGERYLGCADVIRGFPEPSRAMLGLLLLREDAQGKGNGRQAYAAVENAIRAWPEIRAIRIGVVEANGGVLGFWRAMGFVDTGARKPYAQNEVRSEVILLEKSLV